MQLSCDVALPETEHRQPIHYHSLIVETGGEVHRYREVVVMHGDYIYPEYIVAYRRVVRPECGRGAYVAGARTRANGPSHRELELPPAGRGPLREADGLLRN